MMNPIKTGLLAATFVAGITGMAHAAPLGGFSDTGSAIKTEASKNIDNVHLRCYRHRGHLHCSRHHAHHWDHWRRPHLGFYWGAPRRHHFSWYSSRRWH